MKCVQLIRLVLFVVCCLTPFLIDARETLFEQLVDQTNSAIIHSPIKDTKRFLPNYDFIIIGAGSGGAVMANRLTEERGWNVLLLELGKDESAVTDVPLSAAVNQITGYNWGYLSDPTPNACRMLKKGRCNWVKGRAIGGSSVVNFMFYSRGGKRDFDEWAALGNYGWSWNEVFPYFKKLENVKIPALRDSPWRGNDGPMDIEYSSYSTPLLQAFLEAGRQMGYSNVDINGASQLGFSKVQATERNGRRCSTGKAYVRPAAKRKNLHVSMKSWVTKIVIDPSTKTAVGVEFLKGNRKYFVKASKEVILSAGAIGSPQLLMLSGVGPAEHLTEFGIPVIQDLRVGYNLQDHNSLSSLTFLINQPLTINDFNAQNPVNVLNYLLNGKGVLTLPAGGEGYAFVKVNGSYLPYDQPDLELVMAPGSLNGDSYGALRNIIGFTDEFFQSVFSDITDVPAFGLVPVLLRAKSRGRIKLKSRSPFTWPSMQPNYLSDPDDMKLMIEGVKLTVQVAESEPFQKFGSRLLNRPYPGCQHVPFRSDAYWECLIINYSSSLQHQSGTVKMGPNYDPEAVVNPQLQVHGIKGLRVVDASIMPTLPTAHPNSVIIMIGEKAADIVKDYWKSSSVAISSSSYNNQSSNEFSYQSNNFLRRRSYTYPWSGYR